MCRVWITSDLHWGHRRIHKFRCKDNGFPIDFRDEEHHRQWIKDFWLGNITKYDKILMLGDIAFDKESLIDMGTMPGKKIISLGNHDYTNPTLLADTYHDVKGFFRHKHVWMSHAPVEQTELRGKFSIHGHTHQHSLPDTRYQNVCVEELMKQFNKPIVLWDHLMHYRSQLDPPTFKECEYD